MPCEPDIEKEKRRAMNGGVIDNVYLLPTVKPMVCEPFTSKLEKTKKLIREIIANKELRPFVSLSGGKDSTLVLYLVREYYPDVPVLFVNTGVEYPETVRFCRLLAKEWNLNYYEYKPETTFWKVITKYGFPALKRHKKGQKGRAYCCYYLKKKPFDKFVKEHPEINAEFDGLTATESGTRLIMLNSRGLIHKRKSDEQMRIHPIGWWTAGEVWAYIKRHNIPYNKRYDMGVERIGCVPCTAHIKWQEQMITQAPKMYVHVQHLRGQNVLEDFFTTTDARAKTVENGL